VILAIGELLQMYLFFNPAIGLLLVDSHLVIASLSLFLSGGVICDR